MKLDLPLHPTKLHPLTGLPLQAIGHRADGRLVWPLMGGAPDDPPKADPPPADPPKADPPPADPPKTDPPADPDAGGFPPNTKVEDMTVAQQAAYWRSFARRNQDWNKEWLAMFDGKKPDEVKADLEALRTAQMSEADKALAAARVEGKREAAVVAARAVLDANLSHVPDEPVDGGPGRRTLLIDTVDLSKVVTESGEIDTARVKQLAQALAPSGKDGGGSDQDFGQGNRRTRSEGGVGAGRSLWDERNKKRTSTSAS